MLPEIMKELNEELDNDTEYEIEPSRTYCLNQDRTISGYVDELEAVKQAVGKILQTERYENSIYSWDYGIEAKELIGEPMEYAIPELRRRIVEALETDDRIERVDSFKFETKGRVLVVSFMVHSLFGDYETSEEVEIGV